MMIYYEDNTIDKNSRNEYSSSNNRKDQTWPNSERKCTIAIWNMLHYKIPENVEERMEWPR